MLTEISSEIELDQIDEHTELEHYAEQIRKYRAGAIDEIKMQKWRLHFGTYAQRQEGVQMQRIKVPGGFLTSPQLEALADVAERYASDFMHFTTREDVQLYYVNLDQAPIMLGELAREGLTGREACGNTVRNITACYRAGSAPDEAFDVWPYAQALFEYLVRNKFNQNLGRKFKIAFEGCSEDHSALRIHDIGFHAAVNEEGGKSRRGFRVFLGGGLGAGPQEARLYTEFLPEEELFGFATSILRLFDRYGERKSRMKARMKFLVNTMGWEALCKALDAERESVGIIPIDPILKPVKARRAIESPTLNISYHRPLTTLDSRVQDVAFTEWARDSVLPHRDARFRGVIVLIKQGDLTSEKARKLADVARRYSHGQMRITIDQNIYLPWVREDDLYELYVALRAISLEGRGAETIADVTACPGSDTCRLGIASAKGLATAISQGFDNGLKELGAIARDVKVKISGCPNGCAQQAIAGIGFYAAALTNDGRSVPAHLLFVGGQTRLAGANFGSNLGKIPAKNCVAAVKSLLALYREQRSENEDFNDFVRRVGDARLKELLEPLRKVPSFDEDPSFYQDYDHENERFAVRPAMTGECAGSTVAQTIPQIESAFEWLAQAEAFLYHKEYASAGIAAYEAAAAAVRVPLYKRLVDPFTSDEALWEFENLFVLGGELKEKEWESFSGELAHLKTASVDEDGARAILDRTRKIVLECGDLSPAPQT